MLVLEPTLFFLSQDKIDEAAALLEHSNATYEKVHAPDHPDIARSL